jgi:hypothetical protein
MLLSDRHAWEYAVARSLMFITLPALLARPSAVGFGGIGMKVWGR